jgi:hypothetical protein
MVGNLRAGWRRVVLAGSAAAVLAACRADDPPVRAARGLVLGPPATVVATVSTRLPRVLTEMSGAAMSDTQAGVFFTINDSGNDPLLFALDTTGTSRGMWRVAATNVDWEAVSAGPCGSTRGPRCIYIGDVGDNAGTHANRAIYRVAEPAVAAATTGRAPAQRPDGVLVPERVVFTYPDGRHDVESMYVAADGNIFLITKRALPAARRLRPALVFRIPAASWSGRRPVVAELVDTLPEIIPGSTPFRTITDAALSPDGKHLAVRTYTQVFVFATDSATGRVDHGVAAVACDLTGANEEQGEGVTWMHDGGPLLLTSEGAGAPLHFVRCD